MYVTGAQPGDLLEIELLRYETDDFGTTAVIPGFGYLADLFPDPYLVKWEIAGGLARSEELPGVAVPEDAFAGVIGVAPSRERLEAIRRREEALAARGEPVADSMPEGAVPPEAAEGLRTIPPRELGGNLDIRQLVAGSRLWLPVDVPGALFSIGDLHFAQGDGEVCGTADRGRGRGHRALRRDPGRRAPLPLPHVRDARRGPRGARSRPRASRSTPAWI